MSTLTTSIRTADPLAPLRTPQIPTDHWLQKWRERPRFQISGQIASVCGDCVEIEGMSAPIGAVCELRDSTQRQRILVTGFQNQRLLAAPLDPLQTITAGAPVHLTSQTLRTAAGSNLIGQVVDAFGHPLDGSQHAEPHVSRAIVSPAPDSLSRPPIDQPLQTGVRAIDGMLTCGRGQRLGIIAGSGVGKSTLMGMLARGTSAQRIVIALIGERGREVPEFISKVLGPEGLARSVVVVATSDSPTAQRIAAASTATAIAESFRDDGHDVLLLFDSMTRLAMAHRELGLATGEMPSTNGYPPSVFNHLAKLVERAGRTQTGSITAFYSILVEADSIHDPVADALRGVLDGHIVLNRELASRAHWPPIDVLASLSRCQPDLLPSQRIQDAVTCVRRWLADYQQHQDLISMGAYREGSNPAVDQAIAKREAVNDFLRQSSKEQPTINETWAQLLQLANDRDQNTAVDGQ